MSNIFAVGSNSATPKKFLDQSRPLTMVDADKVFDKISLRFGNSASDTLRILKTVSAEIRSTKSYKLDELWGRLERSLNKGKSLEKKPEKSDAKKLQTAMALLYSGLNSIDINATSTNEIAEFRDLFNTTKTFIENRFLSTQTGIDKRMLQRILTTTDERLDNVITNYNEKVDKQEVAGNKIPV
jgi:hypothetical protein